MPALGRSSISEEIMSLSLLLLASVGGGRLDIVGAGARVMVVCSVMAVMDMTPVLVLWVLALVFLLLPPRWFAWVEAGPVSKPSMKDSETPSLKMVANSGSPKTQLLQS